MSAQGIEATQSGPAIPSVYVHNISEVFGGAATQQAHIAKVRLIEVRAGWLAGRTGVVVSKAPDPYFVGYMEEFDRAPEFIVPEGIRDDRLALSDGFGDPKLQEAVRGKQVEPYMGASDWRNFVTEHGGEYHGSDPASVRRANDKVEFMAWSSGIAEAPPGDVVSGIDEAVTSLHKRLKSDGKAILRLAEGGGGLGNTIVAGKMSKAELRELLLARHPNLSDPGTRALAETFLPDLIWSPSTVFNTDGGRVTHGLQTTIGTEYVGRISPTPPDVCDGDELIAIGEAGRDRLRNVVGYLGYASIDLGVRRSGPKVKFEPNARTTAARHADEVNNIQTGGEGVYISRDDFFLRGDMNFRQLRDALAREGLLAEPGEPNGAVIIIPPSGNIAGIQVHAPKRAGGRDGYGLAYETFQRIIDAVGDREANKEDHPYVPKEYR